MRIYEELFILRPDATDEEIDPLVEQLKGVVTTHGGTVEKTDKWGVRRLAYRVQKRSEGNYILLQFTATPDTVHELERRLRVSDLVLKFITVRIDEKLKRIDKRKKAREKRAARKPAPVVAPPAPFSPAMPAEPAAGMPGVPSGPTPGAPSPGAPAPAPIAATTPAPATEPTTTPQE
jgi:small subunit ribosomal protein S6